MCAVRTFCFVLSKRHKNQDISTDILTIWSWQTRTLSVFLRALARAAVTTTALLMLDCWCWLCWGNVVAVVDVAKYCFNYVLCVVVVLFQLLSPLSRSRLGPWAGMSLNIWAGLSCSILLRTEQRSASQITQSKHCHDCHVTVVVRHVHMLWLYRTTFWFCINHSSM